VLHPVGPLPAAVYWRRRVLVLILLLAVLGGGGWVGYAVATGRFGDGTATAAATSSVPATIPALERVLPSLAGVRIPTVPPSTTVASAASVAPTACTDDMIGLEVRTQGSAVTGTATTFELVVSNVAAVACVRSLDAQLQELVLYDVAGHRIWGSDDCSARTSSDPRTLAPGEVVSLPVEWNGLTSEPACPAPHVPALPGDYLLQGRLDTTWSAPVPLTIAQL
jgi:hypothetical protein